MALLITSHIDLMYIVQFEVGNMLKIAVSELFLVVLVESSFYFFLFYLRMLDCTHIVLTWEVFQLISGQ